MTNQKKGKGLENKIIWVCLRIPGKFQTFSLFFSRKNEAKLSSVMRSSVLSLFQSVLCPTEQGDFTTTRRHRRPTPGTALLFWTPGGCPIPKVVLSEKRPQKILYNHLGHPVNHQKTCFCYLKTMFFGRWFYLSFSWFWVLLVPPKNALLKGKIFLKPVDLLFFSFWSAKNREGRLQCCTEPRCWGRPQCFGQSISLRIWFFLLSFRFWTPFSPFFYKKSKNVAFFGRSRSPQWSSPAHFFLKRTWWLGESQRVNQREFFDVLDPTNFPSTRPSSQSKRLCFAFQRAWYFSASLGVWQEVQSAWQEVLFLWKKPHPQTFQL